MKFVKVNLLLILAYLVIFMYPVYGEEQSNGYIVKLSENAVVLFSAGNEQVTPIGNEYYKAESMDAVYEMFSPEDIETVYPDYKLELFDADYPDITSDEKISGQWNMDLILAEAAREKGVFGNGVKIAIIDSGLNVNHPDLKKTNILQGYNCMPDAKDVTDVTDKNGHGTNVCGIIAAQTDNGKAIAGLASETYIIPLKITDGSLSLSDIYSGIEKAIELECDIINLSLGGAIRDTVAVSDFKSWIDRANDAGIIVVAAAGNGGTSLNYPAAFENVIGVGSVDKNKIVSDKSQRNESVFIAAPGENVLTLSKSGGTMKNTGTSFAAPHVAAAVAMIKELKPDCTLDEIMEILKSTSSDLGDTGYDINYGHGLLNIKTILDRMQEYLPKVVVSRGRKDGVNRIHIHNNTGETISANGYFVKHRENGLDGLNAMGNMRLNDGVTSCYFGDEYDYFMLWDDKLSPYIPKYILGE